MIRTLFGLWVVAVCSMGPFARPVQAMEPGTRIRATYIDPSSSETRVLKRKGILLSADADSLTLLPVGTRAPLVLPRQNVKVLEVSVAKGEKGTGALGGLVLGGAAGALIGFASGDDPSSGYIGFSAGTKAALLAVAFAPIGALIGLMSAPGEQWEPLPADEIQIGLGTDAQGDGMVVLTVPF